MTDANETERGRSVVVRWRKLAERRLNYLVELYESGRWKIYYTESAFIAVIREAREALAAWESLAPPEGAASGVRDVVMPASSEPAVMPLSEIPALSRVEPAPALVPMSVVMSAPVSAPLPAATAVPVSASASEGLSARMMLASPFVEAISAHGVGAEHDLREA